MHIQNMKTLVSQLERLPDEKFFMAKWIEHDNNKCGTVACIAGWCSLLNGGPKRVKDPWSDEPGAARFARKFLGLSDINADALFRGWWTNKELDAVSRSEAIAELNRMIAEAERPS